MHTKSFTEFTCLVTWRFLLKFRPQSIPLLQNIVVVMTSGRIRIQMTTALQLQDLFQNPLTEALKTYTLVIQGTRKAIDSDKGNDQSMIKTGLASGSEQWTSWGRLCTGSYDLQHACMISAAISEWKHCSVALARPSGQDCECDVGSGCLHRAW